MSESNTTRKSTPTTSPAPKPPTKKALAEVKRMSDDDLNALVRDRKAHPELKAAAKAEHDTRSGKTKKAEAKPAQVAPAGHPGHHWFELIEAAGKTRMAVAKEMGVVPMTLHRTVSGEGLPSAKLTILFARTVGADAEVLWAEVSAYAFAEGMKAAK